MVIYTKRGDKGETSLFGGRQVSKGSQPIEVIGEIDEVNSLLGLTASFLEEQYLRNKITQIQKTLFKLGSIIAGARQKIPKGIIQKYEKEIDTWTRLMPPLKNFVFPGGNKAACSLFVARAVVRRLERQLVSLRKEKEISPNIFIFLNRLSDYLFTLARYINFKEGIKENIWKGK